MKSVRLSILVCLATHGIYAMDQEQEEKFRWDPNNPLTQMLYQDAWEKKGHELHEKALRNWAQLHERAKKREEEALNLQNDNNAFSQNLATALKEANDDSPGTEKNEK